MTVVPACVVFPEDGPVEIIYLEAERIASGHYLSNTAWNHANGYGREHYIVSRSSRERVRIPLASRPYSRCRCHERT